MESVEGKIESLMTNGNCGYDEYEYADDFDASQDLTEGFDANKLKLLKLNVKKKQPKISAIPDPEQRVAPGVNVAVEQRVEKVPQTSINKGDQKIPPKAFLPVKPPKPRVPSHVVPPRLRPAQPAFDQRQPEPAMPPTLSKPNSEQPKESLVDPFMTPPSSTGAIQEGARFVSQSETKATKQVSGSDDLRQVSNASLPTTSTLTANTNNKFIVDYGNQPADNPRGILTNYADGQEKRQLNGKQLKFANNNNQAEVKRKMKRKSPHSANNAHNAGAAATDKWLADPSHCYDPSTGLFSSFETNAKWEFRRDQIRVDNLMRQKHLEEEIQIAKDSYQKRLQEVKMIEERKRARQMMARPQPLASRQSPTHQRVQSPVFHHNSPDSPTKTRFSDDNSHSSFQPFPHKSNTSITKSEERLPINQLPAEHSAVEPTHSNDSQGPETENTPRHVSGGTNVIPLKAAPPNEPQPSKAAPRGVKAAKVAAPMHESPAPTSKPAVPKFATKPAAASSQVGSSNSPTVPSNGAVKKPIRKAKDDEITDDELSSLLGMPTRSIQSLPSVAAGSVQDGPPAEQAKKVSKKAKDISEAKAAAATSLTPTEDPKVKAISLSPVRPLESNEIPLSDPLELATYFQTAPLEDIDPVHIGTSENVFDNGNADSSPSAGIDNGAIVISAFYDDEEIFVDGKAAPVNEYGMVVMDSPTVMSSILSHQLHGKKAVMLSSGAAESVSPSKTGRKATPKLAAVLSVDAAADEDDEYSMDFAATAIDGMPRPANTEQYQIESFEVEMGIQRALEPEQGAQQSAGYDEGGDGYVRDRVLMSRSRHINPEENLRPSDSNASFGYFMPGGEESNQQSATSLGQMKFGSLIPVLSLDEKKEKAEESADVSDVRVMKFVSTTVYEPDKTRVVVALAAAEEELKQSYQLETAMENDGGSPQREAVVDEPVEAATEKRESFSSAKKKSRRGTPFKTTAGSMGEYGGDEFEDDDALMGNAADGAASAKEDEVARDQLMSNTTLVSPPAETEVQANTSPGVDVAQKEEVEEDGDMNAFIRDFTSSKYLQAARRSEHGEARTTHPTMIVLSKEPADEEAGRDKRISTAEQDNYYLEDNEFDDEEAVDGELRRNGLLSEFEEEEEGGGIVFHNEGVRMSAIYTHEVLADVAKRNKDKDVAPAADDAGEAEVGEYEPALDDHAVPVSDRGEPVTDSALSPEAQEVLQDWDQFHSEEELEAMLQEYRQIRRQLATWRQKFIRVEGREPGLDDFHSIDHDTQMLISRKNQLLDQIEASGSSVSGSNLPSRTPRNRCRTSLADMDHEADEQLHAMLQEYSLVKKQLNTWKDGFQAQYGRTPRVSDFALVDSDTRVLLSRKSQLHHQVAATSSILRSKVAAQDFKVSVPPPILAALSTSNRNIPKEEDDYEDDFIEF